MSNVPFAHTDLPDAGHLPHHVIDDLLPTAREKDIIRALEADVPATVSGARDNPESALANLLAALEAMGLITDNTSAS